LHACRKDTFIWVQADSPSLVDGPEPFLPVDLQPFEQARDHHRGNLVVAAVVAQDVDPAARAKDGDYSGPRFLDHPASYT
jgi:hypothetical protein